MTEQQAMSDTEGLPAQPPSLRPMAPLTQLERTAGLQLANRFLWLACALALYLIGQLSWVQWRTATQLGMPRFDTLELMSILMVIIEAALVLCALLLALATPRTREAWYKRYPHHGFSYIAGGVGGLLILLLMLVILLAPVLYLHRYPQLVEEAQVRVPLMMLQRGLLVGCAVLISYNLMLLLRHVLRFPWWLAGICGVGAHVAIGWYVTWLSFHYTTYERLNYVFYYNQLWRSLNWFPKLQRSWEFHNIQMPYFAYFLGAASIAVLVTLLLWLPRASTLSAGEQPPGN